MAWYYWLPTGPWYNRRSGRSAMMWAEHVVAHYHLKVKTQESIRIVRIQVKGHLWSVVRLPPSVLALWARTPSFRYAGRAVCTRCSTARWSPRRWRLWTCRLPRASGRAATVTCGPSRRAVPRMKTRRPSPRTLHHPPPPPSATATAPTPVSTSDRTGGRE